MTTKRFEPTKFFGEWKEYERYVQEGKPMLYPKDAKEVKTQYTGLQLSPLRVHLVNSYVSSLFGFSVQNSIQGIATGYGTLLDVEFQVCCSLFAFTGQYEILDFEEKDGTYTHLFVGSGNDEYRWILVRNINEVDLAVVDSFKSKFPGHVFFKSQQQ